MADLGGGGAHPARAPPPFEIFLYNCPPPFCTPPLLKPKENNNKTEMCRNTEMCRLPPPPSVWDLRDYRRWWRSDNFFFVGVAPPPPSPACQLFWDLRDSRRWWRSERKKAGGGPKKNSVVPPPPFFKSCIRP